MGDGAQAPLLGAVRYAAAGPRVEARRVDLIVGAGQHPHKLHVAQPAGSLIRGEADGMSSRRAGQEGDVATGRQSTISSLAGRQISIADAPALQLQSCTSGSAPVFLQQCYAALQRLVRRPVWLPNLAIEKTLKGQTAPLSCLENEQRWVPT